MRSVVGCNVIMRRIPVAAHRDVLGEMLTLRVCSCRLQTGSLNVVQRF